MAETVARMSGSSSTISTRTSRIGGGLRSGHWPWCARFLWCRLGAGQHRQGDDEGASAARGRLDPDATAVALDDAAADVQAEAHSGVGDALYVGCPIETVEDSLPLAGWNPDAVVNHRQARLVAGRLQPDLRQLTVRRVLQGILDEVVEHLLHAQAIDRAQEARVRLHDSDVEAVIAQPPQHGVQDFPQVCVTKLHDLGALFEPLRVEQLADEVAKAPRLADDA